MEKIQNILEICNGKLQKPHMRKESSMGIIMQGANFFQQESLQMRRQTLRKCIRVIL